MLNWLREKTKTPKGRKKELKFSVSRASLLPAMKQITPLARGSKLPVLSCCLLRAGEASFTLRATDLEADLVIQLPAEVSIPGSCCLPADRLRAITQELDAGSMISLEADGKGWIKLNAGKSRFRLASWNPEDYPGFLTENREGAAERFTLSAAILHGLISRTSFAAEDTTEQSKQVLSGLLWRVAGDILTLVATDGHRLAISTHALPAQEESIPLSVEAILPAGGLKPLLAMLGGAEATVSISLHPRGASFSTPTWWSYSLRALEGPYPEYEYVIPKDHSREMICDRQALEGAISRCALINNKGDSYSGVRLEMAGGLPLVVSAKNELGEAREELDAVYIGDPLSLLMSIRYLREALERGCEGSSEVRLLMNSPAEAVMVMGAGDECGVIMPMREN